MGGAGPLILEGHPQTRLRATVPGLRPTPFEDSGRATQGYSGRIAEGGPGITATISVNSAIQ